MFVIYVAHTIIIVFTLYIMEILYEMHTTPSVTVASNRQTVIATAADQIM